jgi:subtilisin family serine protease
LHIKGKLLFSSISLLLLISNYSALYSQSLFPDSLSYRYWIYFKDKGEFKPGDIIEQGSDAYNMAKSELTQRALWRRSKVLPENEIVNYNDIPVHVEYVEKIKTFGLKPHAVSKWFNAVSVIATNVQLKEIKGLDFVSKIEAVHFLQYVDVPGSNKKPQFDTDNYGKKKIKFDYGPSFWQNEQVKVPILHYCGITGWGVILGMCDDGFNWRNHQALKNAKVVDEYDWIFKDDSAQNQFPPNQFPEDVWDQDAHGTSTMSTIGGFYEGKLIGTAYDVDFYLSKTEDDKDETPVEEDYWLEAVEWMEARGVDIVTCSLIYKPYDPPNDSYDYNDMDGNTTVIVRAADYAAHLGVVVLNSMGNERQTNPPSVVSPPDGDSVIAVGAVDSSGIIASFSSNGPTSDGRIKPDVVAPGIDVYTAMSETVSWDDSSYSYSSGTSYSCPITAGVCALILSSNPGLTPMQVVDALRMTADRKDDPDNVYGWGLINAYDAALYNGMVMSNKPEIKIEDDKITVSIYILSNNTIKTESAGLYYSLDGSDIYQETPLELVEKFDETNSGRFSAVLPAGFNFEILKLYFIGEDSQKAVTAPYDAPNKFFVFDNNTKKLEIY